MEIVQDHGKGFNMVSDNNSLEPYYDSRGFAAHPLHLEKARNVIRLSNKEK